MQALAAAKPDILVLSSHIQDGIAFRRAFLAAGLAGEGVHGDDHGAVRPGLRQRPRFRAPSACSPRTVRKATSIPDALDPQARALYNRFAALWKQRTGERRRTRRGSPASAPRGCSSPTCSARPAMTARRASPRRRAHSTSPSGSLPNGGGVLFSTRAGPARPEHPGRRGGVAVAGAARQRGGLAAGVRDRSGEACAARIVIG